MADRILGLFAKQPRPGQVKTRLAADTSAAWAARAAEAFLLDLLDRLTAIHARRVLAYDPPGSEDFFLPLANARFELAPQTPGNLGERMAGFFTCQLEQAERVVLVGSDAPSLPLDFIEQAFTALADADVVLVPASDGGYCLIGCARRLPPIFHNVRWSTEHVLADTIRCLQGTDQRLVLLPPWYDVDTLADWYALRGHLAALAHAGLDPGLPRIRALEDPPRPGGGE